VKFKFQSSMRYCMRLKDKKTDARTKIHMTIRKRRKLNDGNKIIFCRNTSEYDIMNKQQVYEVIKRKLHVYSNTHYDLICDTGL